MKSENILRLSMIVGEGQTRTFKKNLLKLVKAVLFDDHTNGLSIDQIRCAIHTDYELEFINEEIETALRESIKCFNVIRIKTTIESSYGKIADSNIKYTLSIDEYELFKKRSSRLSLENLIEKFLNENSDLIYSATDAKDILTLFFYNSFNQNRKMLLDLLSKNFADEFRKMDLTNQQRIFINRFLNWDNKEKDEFIYRTISYCVDYCLLTVKKDQSSFANIFRGKSFYLDSNVIFRLLGLNNEERKAVIKSFLDKCSENGIIIKYTNFTLDEIMKTLSYAIDGLRGLTCDKAALKTIQYERFLPPRYDLNFLKSYNTWRLTVKNGSSGLREFEVYLKVEVNRILRAFTKETVINFQVTESKRYTSLIASLHDYKKIHCATFSESSITYDVNNFMHILMLRETEKGDNFFNLKAYMISTDSYLCSWSKEILPGSIPIVVLPSVWHSLILKFAGRTNHDNKAFVSFLNLRLRVVDDDFDKRRPEILDIVQKEDLPEDIKDKMLDYINNHLSSIYSAEEDSQTIVKNAQSEIIEIEKKKYANEQSVGMMDKGLFMAYENIAEIRAREKQNRYTNIKNISAVLVRVFLSIAVIGGIAYLLSKCNLTNSSMIGLVGSYITIISVICATIGFIVKPIIEHFNKSYETYKEIELKKILKQIERLPKVTGE